MNEKSAVGKKKTVNVKKDERKNERKKDDKIFPSPSFSLVSNRQNDTLAERNERADAPNVYSPLVL